MTLSFWKVPFSAQEVLDLVQECDTLQEFEGKFCERAEELSRAAWPQQSLPDPRTHEGGMPRTPAGGCTCVWSEPHKPGCPGYVERG